ncbi:helix-turn-helix domain-containing protein [Candidatus Gottesmanbacteria bacterium]|nr:helix-turn-helix domain-containing protein [Candidatus Gottesmanbacteria bacterium]
MPKTYTVKEVSDILGYSTNSIYSFLKEKRIKGVRVGKGRFRIPEEELRRVLHLSKNPKAELSQPVATQETHDFHELPAEEGEFTTRLYSLRLNLPDMFSWFVGLAAITSGLALFLFNNTFTISSLNGFTRYVGAERIVLIACGIGIILGSVMPKSLIWQRIFFGLLGIVGLAMGIVMLLGDQPGAAVLYAGLGLVIWIYIIFRLRGLTAFGIYGSLLFLALPVVELAARNDVVLRSFERTFAIPHLALVGVTAAAALVYIVSFWMGWRGNKVAALVAAIVGTLIFYSMGLWYAQLQLWSRSFFIIVVGFFNAIAPFWRLFTAHSFRRRIIIHGFATFMGMVLVVSTLVVGLLQTSIWNQNRQEFLAKLSFGSNLMESAIGSVESAGTTAATNPLLATAFQKKDAAQITAISKVMYEGNDNIRRLVFIDAKGKGIALYPYGTFDVTDYSFRDYFIKARDTGKPYLSNGFQALVDNAHRYVAVVGIPVFDSKGAFSGVFALSLDFSRLSLKLARSAIASQEETFSVVDANGKILIGGDEKKIGTSVGSDGPLALALKGQQGVVEALLPDGTLGMHAYGPINGFGWAISIAAPVNKVFELTAASTIAIFSVIVGITIFALVAGCFIQIRFKTSLTTGSGP